MAAVLPTILQLTEKWPEQFLYNGIALATIRFKESHLGQKKIQKTPSPMAQ